MKDWTGNKRSSHATLGSSNHVDHDREENDYYATDPIAIDLLINEEPDFSNILEPSCGEGHLSTRLKELGYEVTSSDLIDRGYGEIDNFLYRKEWDGDIITNPPYKYAKEFVEKSMAITPKGSKIAMFLKLLFLEGSNRRVFFKRFPPKVVYVSSARISCAMGGDFVKYQKNGGSIAYAWYLWENGYKGDTLIKWIN